MQLQNNNQSLLHYRVLLLGGPQVGKSSLCAQFLSSEHINAYDRVGEDDSDDDDDDDDITGDVVTEDTVCKEVSVAVNDEEKRLVFVDHQHGDMSVRLMTSIVGLNIVGLVFPTEKQK